MSQAIQREPILLPNWNINPVWTHKGRCHGQRQMTPSEEVVVDVVSEAIARAMQSTEQCHWEEALFDLDTAIALMPDHPIAHWNRAHVLLSMGRYEEGFRGYESRFQLLGDQSQETGIRRWRGESLLNKRVLVAHEYGYGDSFMLARYLPIFKTICKKVTLALPSSLHRLFEQFDVEVLKSDWQSPHRYDFHIPMFSALTYMAKAPDKIPPSPYMTATARQIGHPYKPAIGIAWSGDRENTRDKHRSMALDEFMELLDYTGYTLYSIQSSDIKSAERRGLMTINYYDWEATASLIMAMDHIVSVDTASAHLAGALGHSSTHIAVSHSTYWPWYRPEAWYPTANVYRQDKPGEWGPVFERINRAVSENRDANAA